jgi:hypothetical protein
VTRDELDRERERERERINEASGRSCVPSLLGSTAADEEGVLDLATILFEQATARLVMLRCASKWLDR